MDKQQQLLRQRLNNEVYFFVCWIDNCRESFVHERELEIHCSDHDKKKSYYECDFCQMLYTSLFALMVHLRSHAKVSSRCIDCNGAYSGENHVCQNFCSCRMCGRLFLYQKSLF